MNLSARLRYTRNRRRAIAFAIVCLLMPAVPSCIPPIRQPETGLVVPPDAQAAASTENSAHLTLEEFFEDPLLTSLIHQGMAGNRELRMVSEDVQMAGNVVMSRRGAYLPFMSLAAGAGLNKFSSFMPSGADIRDDPFRPGQFFVNPLPDYLLAANVSWQIDVWRQLRNARDAAGKRFLATNEGRNYIVTRLVAEIAENYYELMALDARLDNLNNIIALQEQSLKFAESMKAGARGTELPVQRFRAEVQKNLSEKLIIKQDIIQTENKINYLLGRFPVPVQRRKVDFIEMTLHTLNTGVPSQLILNRPDIRQAERQLEAAGLDVKVAKARFFPVVMITGSVGYEAFNPRYLFITPESLIGSIAGGLVAPFINRLAIKADYLSANATQLQAVYNYQRVIINAFVEVVNRVSKVENYRISIEIKKQQVKALEASVDAATKLFQNARAEYIDVLFAQRDLLDARRVLIDTKNEQLAAIVNAFQALGGGNVFGNLMPVTYSEPPVGHN